MQGKIKSESRKENIEMRLYPNPLVGEELSIDFNSLTNGIGVFSIHDLDGKILYQKELQISEGWQQWKFAPTLSKQKLYVAKLIWQNGATEFMLSKQ